MNKDNAAEYLPLVQALAEGKTIQFFTDGKWCDSPSCQFAYGVDRYRIKPEPGKVYVMWTKGNTGWKVHNVYSTDRQAQESRERYERYANLTVRILEMEEPCDE